MSRHYESVLHRGLTDDAYIAILVALDSTPKQLPVLLEDLFPADIADLLERLPREHRAAIINATPPEHLSEVISHLEEGVKEHVVQLLNPEQVAIALTELESDDAADLAQTIEDVAGDPETDAENLLTDHQHKHLLEFKPDTAGGIMQVEVVTALPTDTVLQTLDYLREHQNSLPGNPGSVFVVNKARKLLGTVSLNRLIKADFSSTLESVMRQEPLTLQPEASADDVTRIFEKYDIHNLAVVNKRGQLLGRVTIDDVLDLVMDEAAYRQGAAAGVDTSEDLFLPVIYTVRKRMTWLIINLLTAVASSAVIAMYEDSIAKLTALAVLMPIIASMGGNATTQTQTVMIRAMAMGHVTRQNVWWLLRKELMVGSLKGVILGILAAIGTWFIFGNLKLSLVIALASVSDHIVAAVGGWATPLVLKRMGHDPAIATGVITTTFTDMGGFFVFLSLATLILM